MDLLDLKDLIDLVGLIGFPNRGLNPLELILVILTLYQGIIGVGKAVPSLPAWVRWHFNDLKKIQS